MFIDHDGRHLEQAALDEAVAKLQTLFPAHVFLEIGPVQAPHGGGRLPWSFRPPNEATKITEVFPREKTPRIVYPLQ